MAAFVSLAAVSGFSLLLGTIFLPAEARRLRAPRHVSVTHVLVPGQQKPCVSLYWSIPENGLPGWKHHLAVDRREHQLVTPSGERLEPLSISAVPGKTQAILGNWDGSLHLFDYSAGKRRFSLIGKQADGGVEGIVCSHDGRFALSQNAFTLYGWKIGQPQALWRRNDLQVTTMATSPAGLTALVAEAHGGLLEIDVRTGNTLARLAQLPSPVMALSHSTDGRRLGMLLASGEMQVRDSRTLRQEWIHDSGWHVASGRVLTFSPDGSSLVTTDPNDPQRLAVWALSGSAPAATLAGHEGIVLGAAFADDGVLWSWSMDGTIRTWDATSGLPTSTLRMEPVMMLPG